MKEKPTYLTTSIREFIKKPRFYIAALLIHAGYLLKFSAMTAAGWRIGLYRNSDVKAKHRSKKKLIILAKSAGVEDIEAAYRDEKAEYAVMFLPRRLLKISCHYFIYEGITDVDYRLDEESLIPSKMAYRNHLEKVLKSFDKLFGLSAVLQFSILYYAERELAAACSNLGIPFIAAHKENLRSDAAWDHVPEDLKKSVGKFNGYKISVYNENAKKAMLDSGIVDPWQISVNGCPRMDFSHDLRYTERKPSGEPTILYYMIVPIAGLTVLFTREELKTVNWNSMISKVNSSILNVATKNKNINIIAKGKRGFSAGQIDSLGEKIPKNIKPIRDGVGHYLLSDADVVIGFNTTAICEAMAAGIPVVVPHIFSKQEKKIAKYSLNVCDAVYCPKSKDEFEQTILKLSETMVKSKKLDPAHKTVLDNLMGNSDGRSGKRLKAFIDDAVNTKREEVINAVSVV